MDVPDCTHLIAELDDLRVKLEAAERERDRYRNLAFSKADSQCANCMARAETPCLYCGAAWSVKLAIAEAERVRLGEALERARALLNGPDGLHAAYGPLFRCVGAGIAEGAPIARAIVTALDELLFAAPSNTPHPAAAPGAGGKGG